MTVDFARFKPVPRALFTAIVLACFVSAVGDDPASKPRNAGEHWSFRPIRHTAPPAVSDVDWPRNGIDHFILRRLESAGIAPAHEAPRTTLIRRLSLDLLGLPPTPGETDAFVNDSRSDAYERLVDRLLQSPHYGERWGRHWLDLAHYADSNGYTIDGGRSIWKFRDWVITALNRDLPFDQFAICQIAGDMLGDSDSTGPQNSAEPPSQDARFVGALDRQIATGFFRNTLRNEEGGTDPEQFRIDAVADRVNTTSAVFLGLTVACARCHDHKYDPISQRDYYQLFAMLNNADEPTLAVPTTQQSKEEPALLAEIAEAEKRLRMVDDNSGTRQMEWERQLAGRLDVDWKVLDSIEFQSSGGATIRELDDGSLLLSGTIPPQDCYRVVADVPAGTTAIRLEALTHDSLPQRGPGLAGNGNFVLSEISIAATPPGSTSTASPLVISSARAEHAQNKYPIADAFDGKLDTGWAINIAGGKLNVDRTAVFILRDAVRGDAGAGDMASTPVRLTFTLEQRHTAPRYHVGRFRLSAAAAPRESLELSEPVRQVLKIDPNARTDPQKKQVRDEFNTVDKERIPIAGRVNELKELHKQLKSAITTTLVLRERAEPRETFVHQRGDFLRPGERVTGAVPAVLPPIRSKLLSPNRLDFARWLVANENPLTPRVTVNRVWQQYFGQGLVSTENDFGTQGAAPTHPELLDWLAAEFIARGWSLKELHRLIMTSATYRQSSKHRPELAASDPNNKLLARQLRIRLEAEVIRDVALAASGVLAAEVGGPGTYPPQPQGIYRFTQVAKFWADSRGSERFRRGLYTFFWRSSPYPFLMTFDAPDANVACTRRVRSNTPLQALTIANDPAFIELAQGLALRVLRESPTPDADRLRHAFRLCLTRDPATLEITRLSAFLQTQRTRFEQSPRDADAAAPKDHPSTVTAADAAAWTTVARVLMNLDEFITRE